MITTLLVLALLHTRKRNSQMYCTHTHTHSSIIKPSLALGVVIQLLYGSTVALIYQHSNVHIYSRFMWIKGRIPWLPRRVYFSFFHRTAELLPSAGVVLFSEILLNFSIKWEVHTET